MLALQAVKDPLAVTVGYESKPVRRAAAREARGWRGKLQVFVRVQRRLHQFIERGLTEHRPEVRPDIALR